MFSMRLIINGKKPFAKLKYLIPARTKSYGKISLQVAFLY